MVRVEANTLSRTEPNILSRRDSQLAIFRNAKLPISEWGKGSAKSPEEFERELRNGEVNLRIGASGELIRTVLKSHVTVIFEDKILVESHQVYYDRNGPLRIRDREKDRVSEKATEGEDPRDTALRGLKEELKLVVEGDRLKENKEKSKIVPSTTYPGVIDDKTVVKFTLELTEEEFAGLQGKRLLEVQEDKVVVFEWRARRGAQIIPSAEAA